eukprot:CAMPEP_0181219728 /NCGR_PEP_ID=MMETSP1096-20121128/28447_1 /TAXON_ID=156174 ORGANISM="Chrysochromulina ericina, Strain CCMP281" /NCGR_SAMPLE_ID=MMETSP1096 /ASSEMBLY_ACC=CAM_ASM_000453 /LENGTH=121 /DNA_ID=CAMNT_0023312161 /DNA_START=332 /DNA_END=696 /DNA_ORIENTATION=-
MPPEAGGAEGEGRRVVAVEPIKRGGVEQAARAGVSVRVVAVVSGSTAARSTRLPPRGDVSLRVGEMDTAVARVAAQLSELAAEPVLLAQSEAVEALVSQQKMYGSRDSGLRKQSARFHCAP